MAFMISRETENVKSSEEIESAFRALSSEGKQFVTREELYQVLQHIYKMFVINNRIVQHRNFSPHPLILYVMDPYPFVLFKYLSKHLINFVILSASVTSYRSLFQRATNI